MMMMVMLVLCGVWMLLLWMMMMIHVDVIVLQWLSLGRSCAVSEVLAMLLWCLWRMLQLFLGAKLLLLLARVTAGANCSPRASEVLGLARCWVVMKVMMLSQLLRDSRGHEQWFKRNNN